MGVRLMKQIAHECELDIHEPDFMNEIERIGEFEKAAYFFNIEKELLKSLYSFDKKTAQQQMRLLTDHLLKGPETHKVKSMKYYLIILSSIVARHLEQNHLTASKAFGFNVTCIRFVEKNLLEDNAAEIADELIEFFAYVLAEQKKPALRHQVVNDVIVHINEDVESSMTVEEIAHKFDISTSHLSRIFREHSGITLVEYINIRKVEEAQYYLRFSDKKIAQISEQFNFCNQSYFTRIFKKYTGDTPRRFRYNMATSYFKFTLPEEE